jgi:putative tryptophan/tyrosine transport system substrate-binding protein
MTAVGRTGPISGTDDMMSHSIGGRAEPGLSNQDPSETGVDLAKGGDAMTRRAALGLIAIAGALLVWPWPATPQPAERMRSVGVLIALSESDPELRPRITALEAGLREQGWVPGRNVEIRYRFAADASGLQRTARELVASAPDVIVASSGLAVFALQRETRTIPIVFVTTSDPIGDGFVGSLARPAGNTTGFTNSLSSMGGKWVELLKQAAPAVTRVGIIFNPDTASSRGAYFLPSFEAAAKSNGVTPLAIPVRTREELDSALADFGREPASGLIVMPDNFSAVHRGLIVAQAAKQRMPAIYPFRYFASGGGLMSYGPDLPDLYRRTASYVDRILKGAKVADLPVQAPTKFDFVINLKAADALGLNLSRHMLARADEVIE